jgi:hypothetical protein
MNKHWPVAFGVLGAIIGIVVAVSASMQKAEDPDIHYHAGFQVYVNNELQDFSDLKYMKLTPCGDRHAEGLSPEQEQLEKAHLHDLNGDVVHVHRDGATWRDLFTNMEWEMPSEEIVNVYSLAQGGVNGENWAIFPENDINDFGREYLDSEIQPNQSVIFFFGDITDVPEKLETAVTLDRVREVENLSEDCGNE